MPSDSLPNQLRTMRIIWFAMLLSLGVYFLIIQLTAEPRMRNDAPDQSTLLVMALMSLVMAAVSLVLPRFVYGTAARAADVATEQVADPNGSVIFRESAPSITVFKDAPAARAKAESVYFTPFIASLALSEAVGIFGVVSAFLGAGMLEYAPLLVLSAILIAWRFTSSGRVYGAFEKAQQAQFDLVR